MSGQPTEDLGTRESPDSGNAIRRCPYCATPELARICVSCLRDTTAPRRSCQSCSGMIPASEPRCFRCGTTVSSELIWKVPLIITLFVIALFISISISLR